LTVGSAGSRKEDKQLYMDKILPPLHSMTTEEIREQIDKLAPWFHNMEVQGVRTAPDHFLGDYPQVKFNSFAHVIPRDLQGKTVLDIGCNAGFYSMEMKRRGAARVVGIDSDERYLEQARFAAKASRLDIEFRNLSVYDVGKLGQRFDLVIFMGVFYHLRHPLLALDLLYEHVVGDLLLFQSMQRGANTVEAVKPDYDFWDMDLFEKPGAPLMYFIEHRYSNDPTNWWIPNAAGIEAMLRSAGFNIIEHPEQEVYLCQSGQVIDGQPRAAYPYQQNTKLNHDRSS
jgi:tRNA (mo5U34)-methyltransferase